jgi:hypothetical protein
MLSMPHGSTVYIQYRIQYCTCRYIAYMSILCRFIALHILVILEEPCGYQSHYYYPEKKRCISTYIYPGHGGQPGDEDC